MTEPTTSDSLRQSIMRLAEALTADRWAEIETFAAEHCTAPSASSGLVAYVCATWDLIQAAAHAGSLDKIAGQRIAASWAALAQAPAIDQAGQVNNLLGTPDSGPPLTRSAWLYLAQAAGKLFQVFPDPDLKGAILDIYLAEDLARVDATHDLTAAVNRYHDQLCAPPQPGEALSTVYYDLANAPGLSAFSQFGVICIADDLRDAELGQTTAPPSYRDYWHDLRLNQYLNALARLQAEWAALQNGQIASGDAFHTITDTAEFNQWFTRYGALVDRLKQLDPQAAKFYGTFWNRFTQQLADLQQAISLGNAQAALIAVDALIETCREYDLSGSVEAWWLPAVRTPLTEIGAASAARDPRKLLNLPVAPDARWRDLVQVCDRILALDLTADSGPNDLRVLVQHFSQTVLDWPDNVFGPFVQIAHGITDLDIENEPAVQEIFGYADSLIACPFVESVHRWAERAREKRRLQRFREQTQARFMEIAGWEDARRLRSELRDTPPDLTDAIQDMLDCLEQLENFTTAWEQGDLRQAHTALQAVMSWRDPSDAVGQFLATTAQQWKEMRSAYLQLSHIDLRAHPDQSADELFAALHDAETHFMPLPALAHWRENYTAYQEALALKSKRKKREALEQLAARADANHDPLTNAYQQVLSELSGWWSRRNR